MFIETGLCDTISAVIHGGHLMKTLLLMVGVIALVLGLFWIGQGLGYIHWPASFMIGEVKWSYYGISLAIIGLLIIWISRR